MRSGYPARRTNRQSELRLPSRQPVLRSWARTARHGRVQVVQPRAAHASAVGTLPDHPVVENFVHTWQYRSDHGWSDLRVFIALHADINATPTNSGDGLPRSPRAALVATRPARHDNLNGLFKRILLSTTPSRNSAFGRNWRGRPHQCQEVFFAHSGLSGLWLVD